MSTNAGNRTLRERSLEQKEQVKKSGESPDVKKCYGYIDEYWRLSVYCKDKSARDKKLKKLRLEFPERIYKKINPKT